MIWLLPLLLHALPSSHVQAAAWSHDNCIRLAVLTEMERQPTGAPWGVRMRLRQCLHSPASCAAKGCP